MEERSRFVYSILWAAKELLIFFILFFRCSICKKVEERRRRTTVTKRKEGEGYTPPKTLDGVLFSGGEKKRREKN